MIPMRGDAFAGANAWRPAIINGSSAHNEITGSSAGPAIVEVRSPLRFKPFVLRCPECSAPTPEGATVCKYCQVPLQWEPVESLSRDDLNWRRRFEEDDAAADPDVVPLGFGPYVTQCMTRTTFQTQAQLPCRPTHLYVPPRLADHFSIVDLRVGKDSCLASQNPLPASWFSTGRGSPVACEVAMPAVLITLTVENKTNANHTFEALLRCKLVHAGVRASKGNPYFNPDR